MKSSKLSKRAQIEDILTRGVEEVIELESLRKDLNSGGQLRVKLGIDPTAPDLHLGHAVVLRKLKQFQNLGHKIVLIIGDFTAQVGDPSGESKERKVLTEKEIKSNMKNYLSQAGKILDLKKTEVRYNKEWLSKSVKDLLELSKAATINQVSERADFRARIKSGQKITLLEAMYSLLQGFDSVKIKADVELGGSDQLVNILMGRQVQRYYGEKEQNIITTPLLVGTDGVMKMSKSKNNYIGLNEAPKDMFGKVMSINDELISQYSLLCTDMREEEIKTNEKKMAARELNPRDVKAKLAHEIVSLYHGPRKADRAQKEFVNVFTKKELPEDIAVKTLDKKVFEITELLVATGFAPSRNEAKRLVVQGGVRIKGKKILDSDKKIKLSPREILLQVGKRRFLKIKARK